MRILITQRSLAHVRGSELVAAEVAKALSERGHDVTVYTPKSGDLAKLLWSSDVPVVTELRDFSGTPEIIHGQHHLPTMAALARFPRTPAIYYCHGVINWVAQPPLHPNIRRYVMMCEWMVGNAHAQYGLPHELLTAIPGFVSIRRFSVVRPPAERLRRALLFAGPRLPAKEVRALREACDANGLTLDMIANGGAPGQLRPEMFLPEYDLVFAVGRAALEAMAVGCAVIPLIPGQAGTLLTPGTFEASSFSNFSPRLHASAGRITPAWLAEQIAAYSPAAAAAVTAHVRAQRTLDGAVERLEQLYTEAMATPVAEPDAAAFAPYLETMAREADGLWVASMASHDMPKLQKEVDRLQRELLDLHRRKSSPTLGSVLRRIKRRLTGAKKGK